MKDPATTLLDVCPREEKYAQLIMFIAARVWEPPTCPEVGRLNDLVHHTMNYKELLTKVRWIADESC